MTLPPYQSEKSLANKFASFFHQKIKRIRDMFTASLTVVIPPMCTPPNLPRFNEVSENEVLKIIKNSPTKSCLLDPVPTFLLIYLFGVLRRFQHCTGHITTGSWKGRGNQYIQFVRVIYCKLLTNGKQLPAFPLEAMPGTEPRLQRWKAKVLPLCHRGPYFPFERLCGNFTSDNYKTCQFVIS